MDLKIVELQRIMNCTPYRARKYHPHLLNTMRKYSINTPLRMMHFLAQLGHESGGLRYVEEIWPNPRLDARGVAQSGNRWQVRYEGRADLGNTQVGDGYRFRGRGLIQLTGRANYRSFGKAIGQNLTSGSNMNKVSRVPLSVLVAGWFWNSRVLNSLADKDDVRGITRRINGGYNGLADRKLYLARARAILAPPVKRASYTVVPGDTLGAVARRFKVPLRSLLKVNPEISNPDLINVGQVLRLPA